MSSLSPPKKASTSIEAKVVVLGSQGRSMHVLKHLCARL